MWPDPRDSLERPVLRAQPAPPDPRDFRDAPGRRVHKVSRGTGASKEPPGPLGDKDLVDHVAPAVSGGLLAPLDPLDRRETPERALRSAQAYLGVRPPLA